MSNKFIITLHKIWKDVAAAFVLMALILISIKFKYNLGMLIGFLILFIFFTFDRIKRIIFDMNVKKIFGIEFGEIEKEQVKEKVREEIGRHGIDLSADEIDVVTEAALNQITGVAYKGRYYEKMISYALKDLDASFSYKAVGSVGGDHFTVDFLLETDNDRVVGIEAAYSDRRFLTRDKIDQVIRTADILKKADNLSCFVLITNTQVREEDKERLQAQWPPIDTIEDSVSPDGILSRIQDYLSAIDKNRKGSLESQN